MKSKKNGAGNYVVAAPCGGTFEVFKNERLSATNGQWLVAFETANGQRLWVSDPYLTKKEALAMIGRAIKNNDYNY